MSGSNRPPQYDLVSPYLKKPVRHAFESNNGFLIPTETTQRIKTLIEQGKIEVGNGTILKQNNSRLTRLRPRVLFDHPIIITPGEHGQVQLHALYTGKEQTLGKGSFGQVRITQDLDSGEIQAAKIQNCSTAKRLASQEHEAGVLGKMDAKGGSFFTFNAEDISVLSSNDLESMFKVKALDKIASITLMSLAPGKPLDTLINELSNEERREVAVKMTNALDELHQKGYLNLDIKLENFMYDPISKQLTMIDFGTALEIDPKTNIARGSYRGSPFYQAPEFKEFFDNRMKYDVLGKLQEQSEVYVETLEEGGLSNTILKYSPASDIYSLGIAYAELFKLDYKPPPTKGNLQEVGSVSVAARDSEAYANNDTIISETEKSKLHTFLQQMTSEKISTRPNIDEIRSFTNDLQSSYKPTVAIIDLRYFENPDPSDHDSVRAKNQIEQAILTFDKVIFVYPDKEVDEDIIEDLMENAEDFLDDEKTLIQDTITNADSINEATTNLSDDALYVHVSTSALDSKMTGELNPHLLHVKMEIDKTIPRVDLTQKDKEKIQSTIKNTVNATINRQKEDLTLTSSPEPNRPGR